MRNIYFLLLIILTISLSCRKRVVYGGYPEKPDSYVKDESNVLTSWEENFLNNKLSAFEEKQSFQIYIYTGKTYDTEKIESFTGNLESKWEIGKDTEHGGLLIALFTVNQESRIEKSIISDTYISDEACYDILHNTMRPRLDSNAFYAALNLGVDSLSTLLEFNIKAKEEEMGIIQKRRKMDSERELVNNIKSFFSGELLKKEIGFPKWLQIISVLLSIFLSFRLGKPRGRVQKALKITFIILSLIPVFGAILLIVFYAVRAGQGNRSQSDYHESYLWMNSGNDSYITGSNNENSGGSDSNSNDYGGASDSWGDSNGND